MAQADAQAIATEFLKRVVELDLASGDAFAVVLDEPVGEHDALRIVLVDQRFGQDVLAEGIALEAATWETDPRIEPFPVSLEIWEAAEDSPVLVRYSVDGLVVNL
jgi:hypothetical protein